MAVKLDARTVATLKPGPKPRYVVDATGLALRIGAADTGGAKTWSVRYRAGRRQRRLTIGTYPTLTLADARKRAKEALKQVEDGIDPGEVKQARLDAETVAALADTYISRHAKPKKRSWKNDQRILDTEVLPHWQHRPAREITRRDVRELIEAIAERGPILANRVRALLHKMFAFALQRDVVEVNPVAGTARPGVEKSRTAVLSDDEVRTFWAGTEALSPEMQAFWRLRMLTGQRGGEVEKMRWSDVDLDAKVWTIPATVAKNKREHLVPLSALALAILTSLRQQADQIVAAREARNDTRPQPIVYVLAGARGNRQRSSAAATFGLDDFRGHDLRRTAATNMRKAGVPSSDISRVLNHVESGPAATRIYDRYDGLSEKRVALDTWARTLDAIVSRRVEAVAANVVPFGARA